MKIYTKKGDKGQTRMLFGDKVSKDDLAPDAYGSVDELVAALGLIRADHDLQIEVQENVLRIKRELVIVRAELATTKENRKKLKRNETVVEEKIVVRLEKDIDFLEEKNGIPEFFVVPCENELSAKFDWARVVSGRAERECVRWQKHLEINDSEVSVYLNRLSDLVWMLAREFENDWTPSK